jgi:translation initiation factor IF-3
MRRHRKGGARFRQDTPPVKRARVNREIKAQTVLVIDATGEQLGERPLADALRLAAEAELDLVEVAAAAKPPVCRIVDYSKFRYDIERKEKLARRNQVRIAIKEVRLRPKIGEHDFAWKLGQVRGFLDENAKVKIAVLFRGRERERPDRGRQLLERIAAEVAADGVVEQKPTFEGRSMFMVVAPTRAGGRAPARAGGES